VGRAADDLEGLSAACGGGKEGHFDARREWRKYLPLLLRAGGDNGEISHSRDVAGGGGGFGGGLDAAYAIAPLRWLARAYVEVMRGTPLLIQLFMIYYGLPEIASG